MTVCGLRTQASTKICAGPLKIETRAGPPQYGQSHKDEALTQAQHRSRVPPLPGYHKQSQAMRCKQLQEETSLDVMPSSEMLLLLLQLQAQEPSIKTETEASSWVQANAEPDGGSKRK